MVYTKNIALPADLLVPPRACRRTSVPAASSCRYEISKYTPVAANTPIMQWQSARRQYNLGRKEPSTSVGHRQERHRRNSSVILDGAETSSSPSDILGYEAASASRLESRHPTRINRSFLSKLWRHHLLSTAFLRLLTKESSWRRSSDRKGALHCFSKAMEATVYRFLAIFSYKKSKPILISTCC